MSVTEVKAFFTEQGLGDRITEFDTSSATVSLAAEAIGVPFERIAKTLTFYKDDSCVVIVASGDAKIDNAKFKQQFNQKAKMLTHEDVEKMVGYPVGGVCPFLIPKDISVYLDISLKRFDTVYPACGSPNSVLKLTLDELIKYSEAQGFIDVCKGWNE